MSNETVLVADARLEEGIRRLVGEACEHARVRPVFWGSAGPPAGAGALSPSLLIAALPSGQRAIPDDVASLATQTFQALPLLLLCGEPLVRHSVSLQGGRVTLLGHPLTREKISARIRTAIVGRGATGGDSDRGHLGGDREVRVREFRGREWWAGVIARDPGYRERSPEAGDLFPSLCKLGRHGVAGLLPLDVGNPLAAPALLQAAEGLISALPSERAAAGLEAAVGREAAAVWFSPATFLWSFYAPSPETELWLYSPLRLPSPWRFVADGVGPWRTLAAASGDVVVASAGAGFLAPESEASLWQVAEGGGPAVLDHLEARLGGGNVVGSAVIVELR